MKWPFKISLVHMKGGYFSVSAYATKCLRIVLWFDLKILLLAQGPATGGSTKYWNKNIFIVIKFKKKDIKLYLAAPEPPDVATVMPWVARPCSSRPWPCLTAFENTIETCFLTKEVFHKFNCKSKKNCNIFQSSKFENMGRKHQEFWIF